MASPNTPSGRRKTRPLDFSLRVAVVAGAAAGNVTVTGIQPGDILVGVISEDAGGISLANLLSEFTITAANTINNTGGTSSAGGKLQVWYIRT